MQVRKILSSGNKIAVFFALTAVVTLATPTMASAGDQKYEGWYAALDLALTQPNSLDHNLYVVFDDSGANTINSRPVIDNEDDFTFKLDIGYGWGDAGSLHVAYWSFDNDDTESGTVLGYVYPAIFGYGYEGASGASQYYLADPQVDAFTNVEATTIDVDYIRPISSGDKFTLTACCAAQTQQQNKSH